MKRFIFGIVGLFALFSLSSCGYNTMVKLDENVQSKWAEVENAYQRRADLIPNLVNTVKGAANFEQETLTQVIEARSKATSINIDASELTPEAIKQFEDAQNALSGSLSRLMAVAENYPQLRATENFQALQAQLEGTENRISVARRNFNEATQQYNSTIRAFPNNLMAGIFGFKAKGYFQSSAGADKAPTVSF
ncbi:LemA family protein [Olivibacter sitiensis]|uniref:LemA family protein n=1 Tax=Olivibacter sitiensis TaxID=376470 RepID=UPI00041782BF|nr:LemA family protein [Olivibacter sitiensis]